MAEQLNKLVIFDLKDLTPFSLADFLIKTKGKIIETTKTKEQLVEEITRKKEKV